jgi:hypothetical protein
MWSWALAWWWLLKASCPGTLDFLWLIDQTVLGLFRVSLALSCSRWQMHNTGGQTHLQARDPRGEWKTLSQIPPHVWGSRDHSSLEGTAHLPYSASLLPGTHWCSGNIYMEEKRQVIREVVHSPAASPLPSMGWPLPQPVFSHPSKMNGRWEAEHTTVLWSVSSNSCPLQTEEAQKGKSIYLMGCGKWAEEQTHIQPITSLDPDWVWKSAPD